MTTTSLQQSLNALSAAITVTGIATLAAANYAVSADIDFTTNKTPEAVVVATFVTTNTPTGNQQGKVFLQVSFDGGSTYTTGPTSGTSTVEERNLYYLGAVTMPAAGTFTKAFPITAKIGFRPDHCRVVVFNDSGVALTTGSTIKTAEVALTQV